MDSTALFIAALILLPALGLVASAWLVMARVEEELRKLRAFESTRCAIDTRSTENTEEMRWPIPG